jgi:hypothetical protein
MGWRRFGANVSKSRESNGRIDVQSLPLLPFPRTPMLILQRSSAQTKRVDQASFDELINELDPVLRPCLRPLRDLQANILGISGKSATSDFSSDASAYDLDATSVINAEVFSDGTNLFIVSVETGAARLARIRRRAISQPVSQDAAEGERVIYLHYIGTRLNSDNLRAVEEACNGVFKVSLRPAPFVSRRFDELGQEGRVPPAPPEAHELSAAQALSDRPARLLAIIVKSSGGLLVRDLAKQLPTDLRDQADGLQATLKASGLIEADIVVVCRKNQAQIARVPSVDVLTDMSRKGVRCLRTSHCR